MTDTATQYETALRPLTAVVEALPPHAWDASSPCEGWSARDVVRHLAETQRETLTGNGVDLGEAPDWTADPVGAWTQHSQRVLDALRDPDQVDRPIEWFFGPTTIGATIERFYVWDMYVHRWDLAQAAGLDAGLTDRELDHIERGADALGEALHLDGMCAAPVAGARDDRTARVLARLGRVA
ncbi:maleylpyruvate isomerase family mycothiol-dependent enzyme [Nocardioides lijunqiniae]|uniref:maleylpyruvate isomerase family mycothiol-dependent enzyme n=1 Tax=Nocardioides lijunqiniae TaxID=2760832 RepID=UPI001878FC2F|nr:maleylpyruvate isomerase family mycothiol-dependent enzyme [Nocardioides lijunqiniae]